MKERPPEKSLYMSFVIPNDQWEAVPAVYRGIEFYSTIELTGPKALFPATAAFPQ